MKILAIMGSAHRGNTLEITQRIEAKLGQLGEVDFEYLHLKDMNLKPCTGCYRCFVRGEDSCPLRDDRAIISQKMEEADGVIFVTPVYSMHVSYLMKIFVDRFAYTFHRPRYCGRYALTVTAAGTIGIKETLKYLKMVATIWGFDLVGELGIMAPPKNTLYEVLGKQKDRTDEVVGRFYTAIKEKKPKILSLSDHITFRAMGAVYSRLETASPVDYRYWKEKGWFEKDARYFCENVRTNFFMDIVARLVALMVSRKMNKSGA